MATQRKPNFFSMLPEQLVRANLYTQVDLVTNSHLANCSRGQDRLFTNYLETPAGHQQFLQKLLNYTLNYTDGEQKVAQEVKAAKTVKHPVSLLKKAAGKQKGGLCSLLQKSTITDSSGRVFKDVSPLRLAFWLMSPVAKKMLAALPADQRAFALQQLNEPVLVKHPKQGCFIPEMQFDFSLVEREYTSGISGLVKDHASLHENVKVKLPIGIREQILSGSRLENLQQELKQVKEKFSNLKQEFATLKTQLEADCKKIQDNEKSCIIC